MSGATQAVKPRIRIILKGYDSKVVDQASKQIVETVTRSGAAVSGPVPLPTRTSLVSVIKSPHKYGGSQEQYHMRTHKRIIDVKDPTPKTIDLLQNLSIPAGCDIEVRM